MDLRLRDSALLPVFLSIRNVSERALPFSAREVVLNLNGTEPLDPADDAQVVEQITGHETDGPARTLAAAAAHGSGRTVNGIPSGYLPAESGNASAPCVSAMARCGPVRRRKGFLFFVRPAAADSTAFNGVMWLQFGGTSGDATELLDTKSVRVKRKVTEQGSFRVRLERMWDEIGAG